MKQNKYDHVELSAKAVILKSYELHCYQVCYYLLHCENKALQASMSSMEHLFGDAAFFGKEDGDRLRTVRKTAMRYSLAILH